MSDLEGMIRRIVRDELRLELVRHSRRGVKMGNCTCGAFSSQLNAAGLCMACASRASEDASE